MPKTPSKETLGYATLFAAFIAVCALLLFVLPAEYGIDPTRIGRLTGISALYAKSSQIQLAPGAASVHHAEAGAPRNDTFVLTLDGLGDDLEFKLHLKANQSLVYTWTANTEVQFDFHGEPYNGSKPGAFASYDAGQARGRSGSFQAPFDGRHGWYLRDVTGETVTVTIQVWGYYDVIGRI